MAETAAERQKRYRDNKRNAQRTESVTRVTVEPERNALAEGLVEHTCNEAGFAHYRAHPDLYVERAFPDKLNWGPWLDVAGLEQAGLKANRVAIPGDWDYEGTAIFIPGLPLSMPQEAIA